MPLLATYTYAGAACLISAGTTSFAHGLPTTPDWAVPVPLGSSASVGALSIPLHLLTRTATTVNVTNPNAAMNAELVAQFVHSIIR